ncbi:MAG: MarR family transcriptional regulator [Myxococcaceae bacterium]
MAQKAALAEQVWRKLFDFIIRTRAHRDRALEKHGLTPNDSRALFTLREQGRPMRELAEEWVCDPSNATWIVDRLERAGLAERLNDPQDRRVKRVALTKLGVKTVQQLNRELYQPPEELMALDKAELERLLEAVERL